MENGKEHINFYSSKMNWIAAQIGAREHYAIPRVLQRAGKLEALYTDFWASTPWRLVGKLTGKSSLATRWHPDLAGAPVTGFNLQALKASRQRFSNPYDGFLQVGEAFGRDVVEDLDANASTLAFSLQPFLSSCLAMTPDSSSLLDGSRRGEGKRLSAKWIPLATRSIS